MCLSTTTVTACSVVSVSGGARFHLTRSSFHVDADGPDESQQFATDRRDHLLFTFSPREERAITAVQPMLRLPRDLFHLSTDGGLPLPQCGAHGWAVAIGPGGFDDDAPKMRVARFGNPAAPGPRAAGILACNGTAVAHELSRLRKTREFPDLRRDRHRRDEGDPAQGTGLSIVRALVRDELRGTLRLETEGGSARFGSPRSI